MSVRDRERDHPTRLRGDLTDTNHQTGQVLYGTPEVDCDAA